MEEYERKKIDELHEAGEISQEASREAMQEKVLRNKLVDLRITLTERETELKSAKNKNAKETLKVEIEEIKNFIKGYEVALQIKEPRWDFNESP